MNDDSTVSMGLAVTVAADEPSAARPERAAPTMVGRYVLLERVGAGGMGVVHRAYDPALDRRVAVKLLKVADSVDSRRAQALLREARAIAQISHPNVISVFDVSTHGDDVFIAMEFIEGPTLREWLEKPHTRDELLDVFEQAARGLLAAHERGVVHRDFKADNVFVAAHGRVVVADFGLARMATGDSSDEPEGPVDKSWDVNLTRPGAIPGTPGYMAPEQLRGEPLSARADQFTFCVVLWEALYGTLAFVRGSPLQELRAIERGPEVPARPKHRVPRWLELTLRRGMSVQPEQRFASLDELLESMRRGRRRRRHMMYTVSALSFGALLALLLVLMPGAGEPCPEARDRLLGVWDASVEQRVSRALLGTGSAIARPSLELLRGRLDSYAGEWLRAHGDACRATHVRHEQSEAALDLRMRCLSRRRLELAALTNELAQVRDGAGAQASVDALSSLVPVETCADASALASGFPPIVEPEKRARAEALSRELAKARATEALGRHVEALAVLGRILPEVRTLGHAPLLVDVLVAQGRVLREQGEFKPLRKVLEEAAMEAGRTGRDDALVSAMTDLAYLTTMAEGDSGRALAMLPLIRPVAVRLPKHSDEALDLAITEARIHYTASEGKAGLTVLESLLGDLSPRDTRRRALVLEMMARILADANILARAQAVGEQALAAAEQAFGPSHPHVGVALTQLGFTLSRAGKPEEALQRLVRAVEILSLTQTSTHRTIARAKYYMAMPLGRLGRHDEALRALAEARAAYASVLGELSGPVESVDVLTGNELLVTGRFAEARELYARTLARHLSGPEVEPAKVSLLRDALGEAALAEDKPELALTECTQALEIHEKHALDDGASLAYPLECAGRAQLALDRADIAQTMLRKSLTLREPTCSPLECATTRFFLARALWESGGDRPEAVALAREALTVFERDAHLEPWHHGRPAEVRAWLDKHSI